MATYSFILNGNKVSVDSDPDVHVLWILRDRLGVTGPKYGCGLGVCQACTCLWNGLAINTCSVTISQLKPTDEITTIEGLSASNGTLHPMQQAWLDNDVGQCGYCQPGQIMAAIAHVQQARKNGVAIDDGLFDTFRNVCRCGTYHRIRQAVVEGAANMP
jgi:isoquinoline 1-oxidoreductase alpha subunit